MNILYVSQYFSFNPIHAAAITTYEIVRRLAVKGHTVTVVVPNADSKELQSFRSGESSGIYVHALSHFSFGEMQESAFLRFLTISLWYVFLVLWALKDARKKRFEIAVAMYHSNHLATASGYIISRILKIPLIVKEHDLVPEFEDPKALRRLHTKFTMALNLPILRHSDLILVLGDDRKEVVQELYRIEEDRLFTFPNGVDSHNFKSNLTQSSLSRMSSFKPEGHKILLYAGALTENRGLENLVRAMPLILEKQPRTELVMVGDGPERERLVKIAADSNVECNIRFTGNIDHSDVPSFISIADVTIGPLKSSLPNSTSFPIKVLEYMACGKPVVGCFGGVSTDLVINGYNGILVHEGDKQELAAAILRLLEDDIFAKELGDNARKHIEKFHNWDSLVLKLDRIMKAQVKRSRCKAG